jgi:hypothetical protein
MSLLCRASSRIFDRREFSPSALEEPADSTRCVRLNVESIFLSLSSCHRQTRPGDPESCCRGLDCRVKPGNGIRRYASRWAWGRSLGLHQPRGTKKDSLQGAKVPRSKQRASPYQQPPRPPRLRVRIHFLCAVSVSPCLCGSRRKDPPSRQGLPLGMGCIARFDRSLGGRPLSLPADTPAGAAAVPCRQPWQCCRPAGSGDRSGATAAGHRSPCGSPCARRRDPRPSDRPARR